jgi:hypothetical protein
MKTFKLTLAAMFLAGTAMAQPAIDICLVTVDTTLTHNIVVWDKPTAGVDSVAIYREDVIGTDMLLGFQHNDSLSEYHDLTADPVMRPYRYKIAAWSGGSEGVKSAPHQTIHAYVYDNAGIPRIQWTQYIGHTVDGYQCWRDSMSLLGGNDWQLMFTATAPNDTDWNDNNSPVFYMNYTSYKIDVQWTNSCVATRAVNHNTTRSNKTASIIEAQVKENSLTEMSVWPNPATNTLFLQFSSAAWDNTRWQMLDVNGRIVLQSEVFRIAGQYTQHIDLGGLEPGIYMVRVNNSRESQTVRFIKN